MAGQFSYADVVYTLADIYMSAYNFNANTYSDTIGQIAAPQTVTADPEHDTDTLAGKGRNQRRLSVLKGIVTTFKLGGLDIAAKIIMTGGTQNDSLTTPNRQRQFGVAAGGAGLPYFGAICTGPTDDGGLWTAGFQCLKLDKVPGFTLDGETNKFSMSEVGGYALPIDIDDVPYAMRERAYETAGDFVAPTDGAGFLAYFGDIA